MSADDLDTAALRVDYADGFDVYARDMLLCLDEIDRLRSAVAAGGVQPAPTAETWTEAEIRAVFRSALFYSAPDTGGRLVFGYADPHVYLDTDPYLPKAEDALLIALRAAGSGSTDQPPAEVCRCAANKSPCDCWPAHISAGGSTDGAGTPQPYWQPTAFGQPT